MSLPKYILAIQSNKCIPHVNTNAANCTKNDGEIQRPKVHSKKELIFMQKGVDGRK
jgi:hypothetical protein